MEKQGTEPKKKAVRKGKQGATTNILARADVFMWDRKVGAVTEYVNGRIGFAYDPSYLVEGVSISPTFLPIDRGSTRTFEFPELQRQEAFQGLPGVFSDSLPDTFGNLIIKNYFASRGESEKAMSPVQKLLYVGNRAMGALEYRPQLQRHAPEEDQALEIKSLVESARRLIEGDAGEAIQEIMRVGGSAGGARAKALILWNKAKKQVRSGFARPRAGDEAWLVKFDGVNSANVRDDQARSFNRVEYTYALLAKDLDIDMAEVSYLEDEDGLFHFMTRRFDRTGTKKHHMHSLSGMEHVDFNAPQAYSYEAWFRLILELNLGYPALEQAYRRMLFNVVGRNQDDHVKNISFLMRDANSGWTLAPAYDLTYAAGSNYTRLHQMTVTGLSDNFTRGPLVELGKKFDIKNPAHLLDRTIDAFAGWPALAATWGIPASKSDAVASAHRLGLRK